MDAIAARENIETNGRDDINNEIQSPIDPHPNSP